MKLPFTTLRTCLGSHHWVYEVTESSSRKSLHNSSSSHCIIVYMYLYGHWFHYHCPISLAFHCFYCKQWNASSSKNKLWNIKQIAAVTITFSLLQVLKQGVMYVVMVIARVKTKLGISTTWLCYCYSENSEISWGEASQLEFHRSCYSMIPYILTKDVCMASFSVFIVQ